MEALSARFVDDNNLEIVQKEDGRVTAQPRKKKAATAAATNKATTATTTTKPKRPKAKFKRIIPIQEQPAKVVPTSGFNVVLTHSTADFDSLASAVGLAKLWSHQKTMTGKAYNTSVEVPTFVVLPRGAHPGVHKFLSLHKHLFPIRSLKSLPNDLSGLTLLGLVDAQRRDRIGPAEPLLGIAKKVVVVDHHIDQESDIPEATDYVIDKVGSVSTLLAEKLKEEEIVLSEAEATLLALGIHADTGSLCYDSTTPRDAMALAWVMSQGASQAAIAEHAQRTLSTEQQGVLTQALINVNSTVIHGVTISTVLLSADGFINGLAAVTQDALDLSSSDVFVLGVVYDSSRRNKRKKSKQKKKSDANNPAASGTETTTTKTTLFQGGKSELFSSHRALSPAASQVADIMHAEAWKGGDEALQRKRLRRAFDRRDIDGSGYLERNEIAAALITSGVFVTEGTVDSILTAIDTDGDGRIDFEEFVAFSKDAEARQKEQEEAGVITQKSQSTMIMIGRAKPGVSLKAVKLNKMMEKFGGGGHPKAASATVRLADPAEAEGIMKSMVDDLIDDGLSKQTCVGDIMTAPVLSAEPHMTEKEVEDLFTRYDVRALPVVDEQNDVIGLVTYKEVAAAKQRLWNKEQKRLRQEAKRASKNETMTEDGQKVNSDRKLGSALKGWMKQHVTTIPASMTFSEAEALLLENDVGCIPVVQDNSKQLLGMVTRTDLLRQHRYYPSLHYQNKFFSNSIANRKPIIALRKRLKKFDLDNA